MQHIGTKYMETERLILRRFALEDAEAMYQNWASDDEVTRYLSWPNHAAVDVSAAVLSDWVSHYGEADYYQWAIVPKDFGQPIGSIAGVHVNDRVGKVEIGYCIGKNWWHQGIVSEALSAVIGFLMDEVGVNRVEACHDPRNPHSGAVMAKCAMTYEGTQRQAGINNQGLCDLSWYAIVASDREEKK